MSQTRKKNLSQEPPYRRPGQSNRPTLKIQLFKYYESIRHSKSQKNGNALMVIMLGDNVEELSEKLAEKALAWERLKIGEATDKDFEWFSHELTESNYEVENKATFAEKQVNLLSDSFSPLKATQKYVSEKEK